MCGYRHCHGCADIETEAAVRTWLVRSSGDLGRAIADLRLERGLTQSALAESVQLDRTYLARLEAGASVLLLDRALRLVRRLGAEVTVTLPDDDQGAADGDA